MLTKHVGFIHAMGMDLYPKHLGPLEGNSEEEKKSSTRVREIS